jgi:SAM-dependent methyltransferase
MGLLSETAPIHERPKTGGYLALPWKLRCAIEGAKGLLPFQRQLRSAKQRIFGSASSEESGDALVIDNGLEMIEWLGSVSGAKVLELGTGWRPIVPILFSLAGADICTVDLHPLMHLPSFRAALAVVRQNREQIAQRLGIERSAIDYVTRECHDMSDRLRELRIEYRSPCDFRESGLESTSFDMFISRSVLEHVPTPVIEGILREAHRILRPGGRMMHRVDHSDHWAHSDPAITKANFLKYPNWLFRLTYLNPVHYHNRLRSPEFLSMLSDAGFSLVKKRLIVDDRSLKFLEKQAVASRFRSLTLRDLATTGSVVLAERG